MGNRNRKETTNGINHNIQSRNRDSSLGTRCKSVSRYSATFHYPVAAWHGTTVTCCSNCAFCGWDQQLSCSLLTSRVSSLRVLSQQQRLPGLDTASTSSTSAASESRDKEHNLLICICLPCISYREVPRHLSQYSAGLRVGRPGFDSRHAQDIFLSFTGSRPALRPNHTPIQWVPGGKRQVPEADHSPPPSAEVKNTWSCTSTFSILLHEVVQQLYLFTSYIQHWTWSINYFTSVLVVDTSIFTLWRRLWRTVKLNYCSHA
jgi:hypothetical protein